MKQYNYVYKITNLVNGKIYIGKHSTDDLDDGYMGSGIVLKQAYQKYGLENFKKKYLAFCDTIEKLNWLEKFYIKKYHSTDYNIGYNLTFGGDGVVPTEEARRKLSAAKKGKPSPTKGKTLSEETKQKISEAKKGRIPWNKDKKGLQQAWNKDKKGLQQAWNKDKKGLQCVSEETKRKMSESAKGRIPWNKDKKGKPLSEETKKKLSEALKGKPSSMKGKPRSDETKQKIRLAWQRRKQGV